MRMITKITKVSGLVKTWWRSAWRLMPGSPNNTKLDQQQDQQQDQHDIRLGQDFSSLTSRSSSWALSSSWSSCFSLLTSLCLVPRAGKSGASQKRLFTRLWFANHKLFSKLGCRSFFGDHCWSQSSDWTFLFVCSIYNNDDEGDDESATWRCFW